MPKIRIHELAKELDKSNKEILDYLKSKGVDAKSHMSSVEDEHVAMVKGAFSKKQAAPAESPAKTEEKPKKKNIIRVFRSQNASGDLPERPKKPHPHHKPEAAHQAAEKTAETQTAKEVVKAAEPVKPVAEQKTEVHQEVKTPVAHTAKETEVKTAAPTENHVENKAEDNKQPHMENKSFTQRNNQNRTGNSASEGNTGNGNYNRQSRPQGENRTGGYQGNRPQGENRTGGYQGNRPQGDNRGRYQGNRPQGENRTGGYQGNRPQGENRTGGYQGNRPQGDNRGGYQGNRPQGENRTGGYQGNRPQGENRTGGYQGNRPQGDNRGRYQGNRPQGENRTGGYQGNRPQGDNRGGYQGNRPQGDNRGGYQGNRPQGDNRGNYQNNRFAGNGQNARRDGKPVLDTTELQSSHKISRDVKRDGKDREKIREEHKGGNRPNQGKRPNQGGGRRPNQRLPRALQKPVQKVEEKKEEVIKEITLPEKMTIRELADKMKMQPAVIVKKLFMEGIMVTVNHEIDFEKAQEIALSYDIIAEEEEKIDVIEELLKEDEEAEELLTSRPPVVCVMGHVDHGKTSLLDAIRDTHVTDREAGGITQHIGAYVVKCNGEKITFLDTPGHEAFTAMRMRGANATDIAILVVAADDGVMPQTIEAINHAKAAGTEIIVAINKIDKPSANIERVKQELSEYELIPEDWGGSTIFVPVSAHTHEGIESLLEMILLTSEILELKANPKRKARGLVIEAELDKGKGSVATILVQKGTLHVGDFIACGACSGKVRAMMDDKGRRVKEAGPSTPVEILGLSDVPNAGEILVATDNDKEAKNFAATFVSENKNKLLDDTKARMSLDDLFTQIQAGNVKELPIIVKADVQGSVEAVKQSLVKLSNEEVIVKVIHGGVGAINESDVSLASASNAIIIGFNVRPDATAKATADQEGVDLRLYRVIYQAIEDVEAAMKGMLDAVYEEKVIGHAEVRQTFKASGIGTIAGGYVLDGIFQRNCKVRITREGEQIFEGELASLKRFKDDVKEVKSGFECGLVFDGFNDVQEEDQVEAYIMVEVPR